MSKIYWIILFLWVEPGYQIYAPKKIAIRPGKENLPNQVKNLTLQTVQNPLEYDSFWIESVCLISASRVMCKVSPQDSSMAEKTQTNQTKPNKKPNQLRKKTKQVGVDLCQLKLS